MADPEAGTSPLNAERSIVGREVSANELLSQLIDEGDGCANLRVISVVGEGGIGKTALVRSVCNRVDVKNHFDRFAWVRIGPEPNLLHLMADLLKQLRVPELRDVDRMDEEKLTDELLRVLMGCRYLIVLDDLCDLHVMYELTMVLADSRNGSRVIVTTRDPNIPSSIDPRYFKPLTLSPLDREQSKKLLEKCRPAFSVADPPVNLLPLKETILSKSGGSPPKILLLGGLLSATTSERCTEPANLLTNGLPDRATLQDVVRLSVDDLPEDLKQCALYLTLFPKESEIPTRRLFRLWSAENLVSSASDGAKKCFEILVTRNMVHVARQKRDGSARSCRLPGSLYDVFYQMAKNERFLKIYDRSIHDEGKFDAPRIAIQRKISGGGEANGQIDVPESGKERSETNAQEHMEITPAEPRQKMSADDHSTLCGIQQLCSYVSFNTKKLGTPAREIAVLLKPLVPKGDTSTLRVLDLEGVYKPSLPEELGNILPKLKYLGLRWTLLERLPKSVGQLSHLETLDVKYTNTSNLPDSILEVENLRHLYTTEVVLDVAVRHQLESKKSLNCNIQTIWGLVTRVDSPMLEVLRKLTGLRKLALTWTGPKVLQATQPISNLKMLKSLRLQLDDSKGEMGDMSMLKSLSILYLLGRWGGTLRLLESHFPPNLKVLTLSRLQLNDDPMGVLGKLKCLTTLRLFAESYNGKTFNVSEGTFPRLRVLKLWNQENLTAWTIQANAMPCLADLEIKDCKEMKTIDGLQKIETLELITLVRVQDELKRWVGEMQLNVSIIAKDLKK